jgi:segregation and condensation protein A
LPPPGTDAGSAVLDYKVSLENFYGPLDLLLHLVREHEVGIETISIARVADQYCQYLEMMQELDINLAAEFLLVAATLLSIKARALVPREVAEEEEAEEDPSLDLIRKLVEYKRFKERARRLGLMAETRARRFARGVPRAAGRAEPAPPPDAEPLKELGLWNLVSMFARLTRQLRLDVALSILYADIPIERFMEMVLDRLRIKGAMRFTELAGRTDKLRVIGTFLAVLQLAKDQRIEIEQDEADGEIRVALLDVEEDEEGPAAPQSIPETPAAPEALPGAPSGALEPHAAPDPPPDKPAIHAPPDSPITPKDTPPISPH